MSLLLHKKLNLLKKFEEKMKKNSYQIENYLKKSENFTMCVYYSSKHHSINSVSISLYKSNSIDIEYSPEVKNTQF